MALNVLARESRPIPGREAQQGRGTRRGSDAAADLLDLERDGRNRCIAEVALQSGQIVAGDARKPILFRRVDLDSFLLSTSAGGT